MDEALREKLIDKIWDVIDSEENKSQWYNEDADMLFACVYGVLSSAAKENTINEEEMVAYLDYKKEQLKRWIFHSGQQKKKKDFGDKRELK
jgi:hypothetical protein